MGLLEFIAPGGHEGDGPEFNAILEIEKPTDEDLYNLYWYDTGKTKNDCRYIGKGMIVGDLLES